MKMHLVILISLILIVSSSIEQKIGEVRDTSSEKYDFSSGSSDSFESTSDDSVFSNGPVFTYRHDSYDEDISSREDPLLIPPRPFSGPWDFQREEVSISGLNDFNTPHRGYPTNLPHLPNYGQILPYPAFNSRSNSEGFVPSTLTSYQQNVQHSDQN